IGWFGVYLIRKALRDANCQLAATIGENIYYETLYRFRPRRDLPLVPNSRCETAATPNSEIKPAS
ncbi:MAG: hypothetical protein ACFB8W_20485, partial [Elainellaceae cyanobacterium]